MNFELIDPGKADEVVEALNRIPINGIKAWKMADVPNQYQFKVNYLDDLATDLNVFVYYYYQTQM